jgi:N4-gp56 family major capsid protein
MGASDIVTTLDNWTDFETAQVNHDLIVGGSHTVLTNLFGVHATFEANSTNLYMWTGLLDDAPLTTPLADGVNPTPGSLNVYHIQANPKQFGATKSYTKRVIRTSTTSLVSATMLVFERQAPWTFELDTLGTLLAGGNRYLAGAVATRILIAKVPQLLDLEQIVVNFKENLIDKISTYISSTTNQETVSIFPSYIGLTTVHIPHDIKALTGFEGVATYGANGGTYPGEFGSVADIRFCEHTLLEPYKDGVKIGATGAAVAKQRVAVGTSDNAEIHPTIIMGAFSLGVLDFGGEDGIEVVFTGFGTEGDSGDPLNLNVFMGWKALCCSKILRQAGICRYETACTDKTK